MRLPGFGWNQIEANTIEQRRNWTFSFPEEFKEMELSCYCTDALKYVNLIGITMIGYYRIFTIRTCKDAVYDNCRSEIVQVLSSAYRYSVDGTVGRHQMTILLYGRYLLCNKLRVISTIDEKFLN